MKWYTLEEKRPTGKDSGLFAMTDGSFIEGFIAEEKGKKRLISGSDHIFHSGYSIDKIWYWIPSEELIMALPKQKHIDFFMKKKMEDEEI